MCGHSDTRCLEFSGTIRVTIVYPLSALWKAVPHSHTLGSLQKKPRENGDGCAPISIGGVYTNESSADPPKVFYKKDKTLPGWGFALQGFALRQTASSPFAFHRFALHCAQHMLRRRDRSTSCGARTLPCLALLCVALRWFDSQRFALRSVAPSCGL